MRLDFFIMCVPFNTTHQHKKIVHVGKWSRLADKPELVHARQTYESLLVPSRPDRPLGGPTILLLEFYWPFNKTHSKKFQQSGIAPKVTKPDCSNISKMFEDCLVRMGFMEDDAQVCDLAVIKRHSFKTGIRIEIIPWEEKYNGAIARAYGRGSSGTEAAQELNGLDQF